MQGSVALDLFRAGQFEKHDNIVIRNIQKLDAEGLDCILMGQIPFGLMDEKLKGFSLKIPRLYVGEAAFGHVAAVLQQ